MIRRTAAALAVTVLLGACGGDGREPAATTTSTPALTTSTTSTAAPSSTTAGPAGSTTTAAPVIADGRHPVYLTAVDLAGRTVTFDLIQFLTGDAGIAAYREDTGESDTPPNDYWIRNVNAKLRTVRLGADVGVRLLPASGGAEPEGSTLEKLAAYVPANPGRMFWLRVAGGAVVDVEQQYLP